MTVVSCLLLCGIKFALCELDRPPYMAHWGQSLRTCVPGACTPLARCNTLNFVPKSVCQGAVFGNVLLGVGLGTILSMIGVGRVIYLFNRAARVRPCAARPGWRTEPANSPWPGLAK